MKIIGHRGAKGLAPENTLASIQKAIELGVDEIEVDVRVTSDEQAVLMHDKTLKRLTGHRIVIKKHSLKQLRRIKPDLATLGEAIELVDQRIPLRIEIKPHTNIQPVAMILRQALVMGTPADRFVLTSFSFRSLRELHKQLPEVPTEVMERFFGTRASWRAKRLGTKRITMLRRVVWFGFVRALARNGLKLTVYTVNKPQTTSKWQSYGLYGVVTDFPDRFMKKS